MTNEEAIKLLRSLKPNEINKDTINRAYDIGHALSMAIKALEQQPQGGDRAVSLNAVKDLFCRICMESNLCYRSKETCEELRLFDKLPPVTPQPKAGHWIPKNSFLLKYKCSECNCESEEYNFCPNCGARMGVSE